MKQVELEAILIQYPECLTDERKLKAVLLDLHPEASRGFIRVLCTVQSAGIVAEIQSKNRMDELDFNRYRRILEDNYGMAGEAVNSALLLWKAVLMPTDNTPEKIDTVLSGRDPSEGMETVCPDCGHPIRQGEAACSNCGCPRMYFGTSEKRKCPECGTEVLKDAKECPVCGCPDTYFISLDEKENSVPEYEYEEDEEDEEEEEDEDCAEEPFDPDEEYYLNDPDDPDEDDAVDGSLESACDYGYGRAEIDCEFDSSEYGDDDYPDYYWEDMFD